MVKNNYTASSLYADIQGCNILLKWNTSIGNFDVYVPGSPSDFLIEDGIGYLLAVDNNTLFNITGMPIKMVNVSLSIGWNMLGWFKENNTHASSLYENISYCNILLKWNVSKGNFDLYVHGSPYDFEIKQGEGFIIAVSETSIWHGEG